MSASVMFHLRSGGGYGLGHLYRGVAVALAINELDRRVKISFLTNNDKSAKNIMSKAGFAHYLENQGLDAPKNIDILLESLPAQKNKPLVIADMAPGYAHAARYLKSVEKHGARLIAYDDLGLHGFKDCTVINQTVKKIPHRNSASIYQGAGLAVFDNRPELRNKYRIKKSVRLITINFGGTDYAGLTERILPLIIDMTREKKPRIKVICGPGYKNINKLNRLVSKVNKARVGIGRVADFAAEIAKSDLMIMAGGLSVYLAAYLGIPAIIVPQTKNEDITAKEFNRLGYGLLGGSAGKIDVKMLKRHVDKVLDSLELRQKQFSAGRKTVTGGGDMKIARLILKAAKNV